MTANPRRHPAVRLTLPAALSLAAHAGAAYALAAAVLEDRVPALAAPRDPATDHRPRPDLGVEDSPALTLNWLGFADPTPHSARRATTDQAALTTDAGVTPTPNDRPPAPAPSHTNPAPDRPATETTNPSDPAEPLPLRPAEPGDDAPVRIPDKPHPPATEASTPQAPAQKAPRAPSQPPPRPAAAAPSPNATPDPGDDAIEDPRESPATAAEPIEARLNGRPIAREGLVIHTVRPDFSVLTRLTTAPRNPVVAVTFGPDGRVVADGVEFVRDPNTEELLDAGSRDRNEPIRNALFNWRAAGPRVAALSEPDTPNTITVELRIVLRR